MAGPQGGTGPASVVTGLVVALAAVVPMVWFATSGSNEPAAADVVPTVTVTEAVPATAVTETIVIAPDPVEVDGLPESVLRALEAAGNLREEGRGELGLPDSIVSVLADHGVVLRVAEDAAP